MMGASRPLTVTMQKGTGGNGNREFPKAGGCLRPLAQARPSVNLSGPLRSAIVSVPKPLFSLLAPVQLNRCGLAPAALSAADWEVVFQKTLWFATYQVKRLRWRGDTDGILPDGYDPNSIAAQAIMEFLQQSSQDSAICCLQLSESRSADFQSAVSPISNRQAYEFPHARYDATVLQASISLASSGGEGRGEEAFTVARELEPVLYEINRLVLKHVTRLYHRKENFILSSAEDLAPVWDMDGELVSALEFIAGPDIQPDEALIQKESNIQFYQLKKRFGAALPDRPLRNLLELRCHGISKP